MLDLFEVLRRLTSSARFGGVFGGDPYFRKLKGTLLGVNSNRGLHVVSLRLLLLRRFKVISALPPAPYLFFSSKRISTSYYFTGVHSQLILAFGDLSDSLVSSIFSSHCSSDLNVS